MGDEVRGEVGLERGGFGLRFKVGFDTGLVDDNTINKV